jgi:urease accessory protein
MLKTSPSTAKAKNLLSAIAVLLIISIITSTGGSPIAHTIYTPWEGLIWGIAEPIIHLDSFALILALGLVTAKFTQGKWLNIGFIIAAIIGKIIYLSPLNLPTAQLVIPLTTLILGVILVTPNQINWLAIACVSVISGTFQGYQDTIAVSNTEISTLITYAITITFTQSVILWSSQQIGVTFGISEINQILPKIIRFIGLAFCAIGILFLGYSVI